MIKVHWYQASQIYMVFSHQLCNLHMGGKISSQLRKQAQTGAGHFPEITKNSIS